MRAYFAQRPLKKTGLNHLAAFCLIALMALSGLSCHKQQPNIVLIDKVLVDDTLSGQGLDISKDDLRQAFEQSLKDGRLRLKPGAPYVLRVSAMTGRMPPEPGGFPVLVVKGQLRARKSAHKDSFTATVQERADSVSDSAGALLEKASPDLCARLATLHQISLMQTSELIKALGDKRQWYRLQALSSLARRRDPQSFDALLPLLNDADEAIALRAVGALVSLGDPRAVKALTDLTRQRGSAFVRQIVYAVATIGGREAEAYLFTVAAGHPDAGVRQAAQAAQKLMRSTKANASSAQPGAAGQDRPK